MRLRLCWIMVCSSLAWTGCTNPSKRTGSDASASKDLPPPIPTGPAKLTPASSAGLRGILAGQVIDRFDRRIGKTSIQLVEVREGGPVGAPLEVLSTEQGYFTIPGLDPNATYQLTARVAEGGKVTMAGTVYAKPPDPRLLIKVSEDLVTDAVPKPPAYPKVPLQIEQPRGAEEKKPPAPPATIEKPVVPKVQDPPPPPAPPVEGGKTAGEEPVPPRVPRPDLKIEVPGPKRTPTLSIPPIPPRREPPPAGDSSYSRRPLPVPSCVMLTAKRIDDFALSDPDGNTFDYRRDRRGKLMLIDFWHTRCPPCLAAIPHLNELQQQFGTRGLEVVGVACQPMPVDQRAPAVKAAISRHDIRYRILMCGDQGGIKLCPLVTQLSVPAFPTLKLVDENGEIVWESVGLGERQLFDLKREIDRRLPK